MEAAACSLLDADYAFLSTHANIPLAHPPAPLPSTPNPPSLTKCPWCNATHTLHSLMSPAPPLA